MDAANFEVLKQINLSDNEADRINYVIEGFEGYVATGVPFDAHLRNEAEFDKVLKLLGVRSVDATRIIRHFVEDTQTGGRRDSEQVGEALQLEGEIEVRGLLSRLIDEVDIWNEDSNYRASIVMQYDDTTAIIVGEELEDISEGENYEFIDKYWVAVINLADIDNYKSWKYWELKFRDESAAQAAYDVHEVEREKAQGIINLGRLNVGDTLKVTTMRTATPAKSTWQPRLTQEELDERFIETWKVATPGEQPIVEVSAGKPKIRLLGGGRWTTRNQNPVQKQERAITPSWGYIHPGQHIMHWVEGEDQPSWSTTVVESIEIILANDTVANSADQSD